MVTVKVYKKDGSVLYSMNTTSEVQAYSHFIAAARVNPEVGKTEYYREGKLIKVKEG